MPAVRRTLRLTAALEPFAGGGAAELDHLVALEATDASGVKGDELHRSTPGFTHGLVLRKLFS